jgi:predicted transcriptional regulator
VSHTLTIRIDDALAAWLAEAAKRTGIPQGRIVREQLEKARAERVGARRFMRLAGAIDGPSDLSTRRGFSTR